MYAIYQNTNNESIVSINLYKKIAIMRNSQIYGA